jgi:hypothetical protein
MNENSTTVVEPGKFEKLLISLPWMARYPMWCAGNFLRQLKSSGDLHLVLVIGNHFEPSWKSTGGLWDWATQEKRLEDWRRKAAVIGRAVTDSDGTPFRHTNFFPAEQYHEGLMNQLAQLQADGFGEVEVHLHHGVEKPDTAENLRRSLVEFRDVAAERHKLLSRFPDSDLPRYAFIHGNFGLANMDCGRNCGVDEEMQILADTGCYADMTLPAIHYRSQPPKVNSIYQCGKPLYERAPHWSGPDVAVGDSLTLPLMVMGPQICDWRRRRFGLPFPRIDFGALTDRYPLDLGRIRNWRRAGISVRGRENWVFLKVFCHGFFDYDQDAVIGETMRRLLSEVMEHSERTGEFKMHFASAREAFNMILAAVDGKDGNPHLFRDYKLRTIMHNSVTVTPAVEPRLEAVA